MSRGVNVRKGRNYFFRDSGAATARSTVTPTMGLLQLFILLRIRRLLHEIIQNLKPNRKKGKKQRKRNHFSKF